MTSGRVPEPKVMRPAAEWQGESYYGRQQLKPAPFEPNVVGAYIFLAGLSGASALVGALSAATEPRSRRRTRRQPETPDLVRRSRYISLLAPTVGSALLVYDLHTPQRFYNMLRIAKWRSPMSIGTWILMSFSAFAGVAGLAQIATDLRPRWRWTRPLATAAQIPAAITGAGLCTYTAALVSATSTPLWAAAPRELAMRFGSSSMATAAAALALGEKSATKRRSLGDLLLAALTVELAAGVATDARYKKVGVEKGRSGPWGKLERYGAEGGGVLLPLGLMVASRLRGREPGRLTTLAGLATLAGSAAFRISILGAGAESARRPEISMRFAQPDNLPRTR